MRQNNMSEQAAAVVFAFQLEILYEPLTRFTTADAKSKAKLEALRRTCCVSASPRRPLPLASAALNNNSKTGFI